MATVTRKGYVYMQEDFTDDFMDKDWRPVWRPYRLDDTADRILIGEQTITFEVPDDFDSRPVVIAALEAQKRDITAKFQAAVTQLDVRISKLQAISYDEAAE